ncbi:hypothetical protein Tco_1482791 [Tanacetum coccineum]
MLLTRLFKHVVSVSPELSIDHYLSHDLVMYTLAPRYEQKTRSDHGKKRPRDSNASSSSTTLNHLSSSRPLDDTIDENDEESFHSDSSSPSQNVSSLSNVVFRVLQNPTHESDMNMWRLRIEQYFHVQDYALWDVIKNGNSFKPAAQTTTNVDGTSTSLIPGPVTTEEKAQNKNDVKARSMLLMTLLNEHLMTFNQCKDTKTLFAAIQTRFSGMKPQRRLRRLF